MRLLTIPQPTSNASAEGQRSSLACRAMYVASFSSSEPAAFMAGWAGSIPAFFASSRRSRSAFATVTVHRRLTGGGGAESGGRWRVIDRNLGSCGRNFCSTAFNGGRVVRFGSGRARVLRNCATSPPW